MLQQAGFLPAQQKQIMQNLQNEQNQQNSLNPNLAQPSLNNNVNQTASPDANLAQPLGPPLNSPINSSLPQGQLQSNVPSNPLSADLGTGQGISAHMMVPAAEQSAANAAIERRIRTVVVWQEDRKRCGSHSRLQQAVDASQVTGAEKSGQPGTAQPGTGQPGAAQPGRGNLAPPIRRVVAGLSRFRTPVRPTPACQSSASDQEFLRRIQGQGPVRSSERRAKAR